MSSASQDAAFFWGVPLASAAALAAVITFALIAVIALRGWYVSAGRQTPGLRSELIVALGVLTTVAALAGALLMGAGLAGRQIQAESSQLNARATTVAAALDQLIQAQVLALSGFADHYTITQPNTDQLSAAVAALRHRHPAFSAVQLVDHAGNTIVADGEEQSASGARDDIRNQSRFLQPMASGKAFIQLDSSRSAGEVSLVISMPVRALSGIRTGVVVGLLDMKQVISSIPMSGDMGTHLSVRDARSQILYSGFSDHKAANVRRRGLEPPNSDEEEPARLGPQGYAKTDLGWRVLLRGPHRGRLARVGEWFGSTWYWVAWLGLGGIPVALMLAKRFRRPLHQLHQVLEDIEGPEASDLQGPREYQMLLRQVRRLQARMKERFGTLQVSVSQQAKARSELAEKMEATQSVLLKQEQALLQAQKKVDSHSGVDPVTGLPSRQAFKQIMGRSWKHAERENEPLTLIVVSLDLFKEYVDQHGYAAGQSCLETISRILTGAVCRPLDRVARCDDSMFGLVLVNTSESGGEAIAQRVRAKIETAAINHKGSRFGIVTVSQGMSVAFPKEGGTAMATWADAHKALQLAKRRGRNAIVVSAVGTVWN